jgi:hypothetical protein
MNKYIVTLIKFLNDRLLGGESLKDNNMKARYTVIIADSDFEFDSAIQAIWIFDTVEAANQYAREWNRAERTKAFSEDRDQTAFAGIFAANN